MLLALLGALLIGLSLGLLGSGGSILTVPVLVYLVGEPDKVAIAESLGIVAGISLVGALPYAVQKEVDWKSVFFFGIPGMIGTYGGAAISAYISGTTQLLIFGVVMLLAAYFMIKGKRSDLEEVKEHKRAPIWLLVGEGLIVGVLTGLVGVGGGFLIIPALVLLGGLDMRIAVGTSLFIIAAKSMMGFYKYLDVLESEHLQVNWELVGIFALIGIVGSYVGNKLSKKIPQTTLKRGFGFFLILMGIFILYTNIS
ncbi:MAG TPA: sulfite exporter TauE/SafE family protein [Balneolaceae bacterium]|nr:sulfite exporter TauE/SafE family protein [Balneolaceae bacterium]|tara:strand:+ start:83017 stop:83778 length:762 start_codon:yes stop_codon:yes gene_type:complete